jgi:hypothetical protein
VPRADVQPSVLTRFHAEPFDSVDEAVRMAHDDAVFLVHDGNDMIADAALKIATGSSAADQPIVATWMRNASLRRR